LHYVAREWILMSVCKKSNWIQWRSLPCFFGINNGTGGRRSPMVAVLTPTIKILMALFRTTVKSGVLVSLLLNGQWAVLGVRRLQTNFRMPDLNSTACALHGWADIVLVSNSNYKKKGPFNLGPFSNDGMVFYLTGLSGRRKTHRLPPMCWSTMDIYWSPFGDCQNRK